MRVPFVFILHEMVPTTMAKATAKKPKKNQIDVRMEKMYKHMNVCVYVYIYDIIAIAELSNVLTS